MRHLQWLKRNVSRSCAISMVRQPVIRDASLVTIVKSERRQSMNQGQGLCSVPSSIAPSCWRRAGSPTSCRLDDGAARLPDGDHAPWFDTADEWTRYSEFPPGRVE